MFSIPPNIAGLIISGLSAEIARQNAIGEICSDEWPDDYDPNDVVIYVNFRAWLQEHAGRDAIVDGPASSKPISFVMSLLPYFVRQNMSSLSAAEIESACRVYSQYAAQHCTESLENNIDASSARRRILYLLAEVVAFPGIGSEFENARHNKPLNL